MFPQENRISAVFHITRRSLITVLVCVTVSVIIMRTGFLTMFYLAPLGYAVMATGSFLFTFTAAAAVNLIVIIITNISLMGNSLSILMDIMYLCALIFLFTWAVGGKKIRTAFRIILASSVCTIVFIFIILRLGGQFYAFSMEVANELLPGLVTMEMLEITRAILLRGGALISMFLMFVINRQIAGGVLWLIKKQRYGRSLVEFFAPVNTIWFFSGALATVIIASMSGIEALEIAAWNVFVICVIILMAQGIGILSHFLAGKSHVFRLCSTILVIAMLFSPLAVIIAAAILVLGIVEIWRPLRQPAAPGKSGQS